MGTVFNYLNIAFVIVLMVVGLSLWWQKKSEQKEKQSIDKAQKKKIQMDCKIEDVEDFLGFDRVFNNMIIRKNATVFNMVIHCSGINFDLMSAEEREMIEESFIELLNFLKFPIQFYVQTRKVDLKDSLKTYGAKVKEIEAELLKLVETYDLTKAKEGIDQETLGILSYEIQRKQNLLEYAQDLKSNIELMSINKNILQYKYYIVLKYHIDEMGMATDFTEEEVLDMAYSELTTRAQSILGALGGSGIEARLLDTNALAELLYVAFNRDDAELLRLKDNMEAGFYRLFSTTESAWNIKASSPVSVEVGLEDQLMLINDKYNLEELNDISE